MSKKIQFVVNDELFNQIQDYMRQTGEENISQTIRKIVRAALTQSSPLPITRTSKPSPAVQPGTLSPSPTYHQPTEQGHVEEVKELTYDLST